MLLPRLARAGLVSRSAVVALVLAFCAATVLATASPASAVTREQAAAKALTALGSKQSSDEVIVFGLTKPVRAGTRVTQTGSSKTVSKAGRGGAFFFYEDAGPFQFYPHPGRVVLVGAKSGKVKVSRTIKRAPLVNGKLPAFLTSTKRYRSSKYRVFYQASSGGGESSSGGGDNVLAAPIGSDTVVQELGALDGSNSPPKANPQAVTVKQNSPKTIVLTGSDDDGEPILFNITKPPAHGTLSGQPPEVTYTPDPGYLGRDDFSFRTTDEVAHSNTAKVSITVVTLGAPPVVTASGGCTGYSERGPGVVVDGALAVSDADDATLDSARVSVAANFARGDDLVFTDQNGISGSYDDTIGVLTLTGTAPVATYEAALRTVRYRNLAGGSPAPTKDIDFTVNDAGSDSAAGTKQVCITHTGPNLRPIGETSEGALEYIENDGPVPVDAGFVAQDTDSADLSGATIHFAESQASEEDETEVGGPGALTNSFVSAEDELAFTDQNGITGSYDDTTGTLTLSGAASVADYEAAIRSVTYENSSEDPSGEPRALRLQVTDSSGATSLASSRGVLVTPVNDAPVITTTEGTGSAIGADPATTVDSGLTTLDVDDDDLEGARVAIASGFESGDDLVFVDQLGISGTYDSESGVLTLTGTAPVADYEAALRTIEYRHADGNPSGSRTIELTVNDGDLDSDVATKGIEVNDKPVLDASDAALSYTENDGPVAVDDALAATDPDSTTFAGATVQVSSGFVEAEDALAFADQNGITGSYDDTTGTLTLSGSASVADYETALRSVTYENSSDDPSTATRTVTFQVDDGASSENLSDAVTRDVEVAAVNDAPVVTTSAGTTPYTEDEGATPVDSGATVADADDTQIEGGKVSIASGLESGDELVFEDQPGITGGYDAESGVLTLSGPASVADYEAALRTVGFRHSGDNPSASRTVEFTVNDGELDSAAAAKEIAVTAVNDKPELTASEGALTYAAGAGAVAVDEGITASDPDSATLTGAKVEISANFAEAEDALAFADQNGITGSYDDTTGTLTLSGSASVADYETALRSVTYENSAESPSTETRTVKFQVDDGAGSDNLSDAVARDVEISVPPANEAPVVTTSNGASSYTIGDTEGTEVDPDVTVTDADDTDLEGAQLTIATAGYESGDVLVFEDTTEISAMFDPDNGVLTLTGTASVADYQTALRSIRFRHTGENPSAARTVQVKVTDGAADSNVALKSIVIVAPPPEL